MGAILSFVFRLVSSPGLFPPLFVLPTPHLPSLLLPANYPCLSSCTCLIRYKDEYEGCMDVSIGMLPFALVLRVSVEGVLVGQWVGWCPVRFRVCDICLCVCVFAHLYGGRCE